MAAVDLDELLLKLKWEEEGARIPAGARQQLLGLADAQRALTQTTGATAAGITNVGAAVQRTTRATNQFQAGWASNAQILQAMQRDAGKAAKAVHEVGDAAAGSGRGLNLMRSALTGLAIQATGTAGTAGRLVSSFLLFGAGSTVVIGAAAGIGTIALAYRVATKDARELREENERLQRSWQQMLSAGKPTVSLAQQLFVGGTDKEGKQIQAILDQLTKAEQLVTFLRAGGRLGALGKRSPEEAAEDLRIAEQNLQLLQQQFTTMREQLKQGQRQLVADFAESGNRAAVDWAQAFVKGIQFLDPATQIKTLLLARGQFQSRGGEAGQLWADAFLKAIEARWAQRPLAMDMLVRGLGARMPTFPTFGQPPAAGATFGIPLGFGEPATRTAAFPAFGTGPGAASAAAAARTAAQAVAGQQHYTQALEGTRAILARTVTPQQIFTQGLAMLQIVLDAGAITTEQFAAAVDQLTQDMEKAQKAATLVGVTIINAIAGAIAGIIRGDSAGGVIGGILGTIGGAVGIGNPILGAGIAGLGQIVSATGSRGVTIDSYSREALEQLRGIPSGPQRIELLIQSPTSGEIVDRVIYTLGERGRNRGVTRVPLVVVGG